MVTNKCISKITSIKKIINKIKSIYKPACTFNPSTREPEAGNTCGLKGSLVYKYKGSSRVSRPVTQKSPVSGKKQQQNKQKRLYIIKYVLYYVTYVKF